MSYYFSSLQDSFFMHKKDIGGNDMYHCIKHQFVMITTDLIFTKSSMFKQLNHFSLKSSKMYFAKSYMMHKYFANILVLQNH